MLPTLICLVCLILTCTGQKAQPPKISTRFLKKIYFRDVTDSKTLDCTALGIPEPRYEWQFNGQTLQNDPGIVEIDGGSLKLLRPYFNHAGKYQCLASNIHGTSVSSVIKIKKAELEGYKTLPVENLGAVNQGSHVVLHCKEQPRSEPPAVYDWFTGKTDVIVTGGRIVIDQGGDLHFINVEVSDELTGDKTYSCSLYNIVEKIRVYGSPTKFQVTPAPNGVPQRDPSIHTYTDVQSAQVLLGETVKLQCVPDGYPLPTIEWSRSVGSLPPGRHIIDAEKYTLEISNVTENDEGEYTCTAVHGQLRSEQNIFVDVKSQPIWVNKPEPVTVTNGKTAKFLCVARSAIGELDNILLQWYMNGEPISGTVGKITVSGTELTVSDVIKPYALMNIQCNVTNSIGSELADAYLNVIEETVLTVRPEPKYALDPGNITRLPIMAEADPLYANKLTYRWTKDGRPVSSNSQDPVHVDVANALVINATEFGRTQAFLDLLGNYSCLVSIGLKGGEGDFVTYTVVSSDQKEEIIAAAALDLWWIAVIVAIVVLILIIILICCLLYRNRGGTYPVDEKERRAGHDPEKELADSGFQDLSRADAPEEKKPYGNPDQVSLTNDPPLGGDTDSLDEYGEPDSSKFNEDGSFIGNYGGRKGRDTNQSTV